MNMRAFHFSFIFLLLTSCGGNNNVVEEEVGACSVMPATDAGCELLNFSDGEIISYRLPILYGQCPGGETSLNITVAGKNYTWPVEESYFKGAVLLERGENDICLQSSTGSVSATLHYEPEDNPKKIKTIYAIAANDDGQFLAAPGVANDLETAKQIVSVQSLMMQSATAEMLYRATGTHQTYSLVEDDDGMPLIEVFEVRETRDELYAMEGLDIYYSLQEQLQTEAQNNYKYLVIMGFSSYADGQMLAHAALGGGNLGIFGGLHLHTCPRTIEEIPSRFSDDTQIDTDILPDDSAYRGSYWANCSTGMGASLHELGHTFGLPHTDYGIMARGIDHFNRLFMLAEPGHNGPITIDAEFDAVWHPDSLDILFGSPWIFN